MSNVSKAPVYEETPPYPEYLIKSIAEQGYSLETSLADLIDNSVSADAENIEILININRQPFTLFIADNGAGMDETSLKDNMKFPSASPAVNRKAGDLGRFGLGMKTASFSQTRKFTVLSRKKGSEKFAARTWDVDFLTATGKWNIIVNTEEEIDALLEQYRTLSREFFNAFEAFVPNTIVVWEGLYKYEEYLDDRHRKEALKKEIKEITSVHLSLVFHRFMERKENPLKIRINNDLVTPFNPFPTGKQGFRSIDPMQKGIRSDYIMVEGFVLPARSIDESRNGISVWTTPNRSLLDMEGIYVYRSDRLILYGGWNGIIKKNPRIQLARLRVDVGNNIDHLLHLNVAKSQIIIPHELRSAFERYIIDLTEQAEKEYFNRVTIKTNSAKNHKDQLFSKKASNRGMLLEINRQFPLLENLYTELDEEQQKKLKFLIRMINVTINKIKQVHEDAAFVNDAGADGLSLSDLMISVSKLQEAGLSAKQIKESVLPALGYRVDTIPSEINELLKK